MKKLLYLLSVVVVISSCSKSNDDEPQPTTPPSNNGNNTTTISTTLPSSFTQKVLIEMFTGANYGNVPDGLTKLESCQSSNSSRIFGICIHDGDPMANNSLNMTMMTTFAYSSIPSGMVNRIPSLGNVVLQPSQWQSNVNVDMAKTAKCGLAINSSYTGTQASIEVQAGFKQSLTGNYTLTVYLTEDEISNSAGGYSQSNNYNNVNGNPYYNLGNPIANFKHNHVVRKVCTANIGDPINSTYIVPGGILKKNISTSINGFNPSKLYIVAFVCKTGSNGASYEIMNVQRAKLSTLKDWD